MVVTAGITVVRGDDGGVLQVVVVSSALMRWLVLTLVVVYYLPLFCHCRKRRT